MLCSLDNWINHLFKILVLGEQLKYLDTWEHVNATDFPNAFIMNAFSGINNFN